jgi:hypothetical protein
MEEKEEEDATWLVYEADVEYGVGVVYQVQACD